MPITSGDVSFKGSLNTVSTISNLGGAVGSMIQSQFCEAPMVVTGVTMLSCDNNPLGYGTLAFSATTQTLSWTPPTSLETYSSSVPISGIYTVGAGVGLIRVSVVTGSLPVIYKEESLLVSNNVNNVFNDVSPQMSLVGITQYRCLYFFNDHPTLTATAPVLFISGQPSGPNTLAIGLDPAGVGNGMLTGVAQSIALETTAPTGVTFTAPASASTGITLPNLPPNSGIALWEKRIVTPNSYGDMAVVTGSLGVALLG